MIIGGPLVIIKPIKFCNIGMRILNLLTNSFMDEKVYTREYS